MNNEQYLYMKLSEESSEISKECMKIMQFGLDSRNPDTGVSNIDALNMEINDLLAIIELLQDEGYFTFEKDETHIENKKLKVSRFRNFSRDLGYVSKK